MEVYIFIASDYKMSQSLAEIVVESYLYAQ